MGEPHPRCVVAGHQDGRPAFLADATPSTPIDVSAARIWRILRLPGAPVSYDDGVPPPDVEPLPPGGVSVQLMRLAEQGWPESGGWRQVPTQDLQIVVEGRLLLGLDHAEVELGPGDTIVQRGARHRMRAVGGPATVLVAHLAPLDEPDGPSPAAGGTSDEHSAFGGGSDGASGVRRLVTGSRPDGTSEIAHLGEPPGVNRFERVVLTDVWQTGGPLRHVEQGGDLGDGWRVEPVGEGVAVGVVELPPGDYSADANWHATATIDVDVILSGAVELHLPDLPPVALGAGDLVVQRGTAHRWQPMGDEVMRMATVRIGVALPPP